MKCFIRVDGSPDIGMGHISRCLSIASELREQKVDVCFLIGDNYPAHTIEESEFQYKIIPLSAPYSLDEVHEIKRICEGNTALFLVDSYFATDEYLLELEKIAPTFYIDGKYKCRANISGVINYNAAADINEYRERFKGNKTKLIVGIEYTPVKQSFIRAKDMYQRRLTAFEEDRPIEVLVTTGATDKVDFIYRFCSEILNSGDTERIYHIVLGKMYGDIQRIESLIGKYKNFKLYHDINNMAELMSKVDLAVSAAGTTIYELLCVGVPTISYGTVEIHSTFDKLAPDIIWLGDIKGQSGLASEIKIKKLIRKLKYVTKDINSYEDFKSMASKVIDGKGTQKLVTEVLGACI